MPASTTRHSIASGSTSLPAAAASNGSSRNHNPPRFLNQFEAAAFAQRVTYADKHRSGKGLTVDNLAALDAVYNRSGAVAQADPKLGPKRDNVGLIWSGSEGGKKDNTATRMPPLPRGGKLPPAVDTNSTTRAVLGGTNESGLSNKFGARSTSTVSRCSSTQNRNNRYYRGSSGTSNASAVYCPSEVMESRLDSLERQIKEERDSRQVVQKQLENLTSLLVKRIEGGANKK